VYDEDADHSSSASTPRSSCSGKRSEKTGSLAVQYDSVSTTGSGSQDDNSSVSSGMEDLESHCDGVACERQNLTPGTKIANQRVPYILGGSSRGCMAIPFSELQTQPELPASNAYRIGGSSLAKPLMECSAGQTHARPIKIDDYLSHHSQTHEALSPQPASACIENADTRTTVMLRSFPNNYSSTMLLDLIDSQGFKGWYNFMYLPMDFMTGANLGYCFMNFTTHENAKNFSDKFNGFSQWTMPSKKCCTVVWSDPHQGLEEYIERYRNSPIMHRTVPIEYKPTLFKNGERIPFPPPTKNLRAPRFRYLTNV
jgi:hypothetical protein